MEFAWWKSFIASAALVQILLPLHFGLVPDAVWKLRITRYAPRLLRDVLVFLPLLQQLTIKFACGQHAVATPAINRLVANLTSQALSITWQVELLSPSGRAAFRPLA